MQPYMDGHMHAYMIHVLYVIVVEVETINFDMHAYMIHVLYVIVVEVETINFDMHAYMIHVYT